MTPRIAAKAATNLDKYIRFRAGKEGVEYALSPDFFFSALLGGCVDFFGIRLNKDGSIAADRQFPQLLIEWRRQQLN